MDKHMNLSRRAFVGGAAAFGVAVAAPKFAFAEPSAAEKTSGGRCCASEIAEAQFRFGPEGQRLRRRGRRSRCRHGEERNAHPHKQIFVSLSSSFTFTCTFHASLTLLYPGILSPFPP